MDWHRIGRNNKILLSQGDELEIRFVCRISFHQELQMLCSEVSFARYQADFDNRTWQLTRRVLGSGSFAAVLLATNQNHTKQAACKVISKTWARQNSERDIWLREVEILKRVSHVSLPSTNQAMELAKLMSR